MKLINQVGRNLISRSQPSRALAAAIALLALLKWGLPPLSAHAEPARPQDSVRCSPHFAEGQIEGYRCVQIAPGSPYDKAGLRDGDVIRSVDGSSLEDPLVALEKLGRLSATTHGPISLVFERAGHEISKTVDPAGTVTTEQKQVNP